MNYKCITETFSWTTKHRKLFIIKQSKGCKFMPEMFQNTFGGEGRRGQLIRKGEAAYF